MPKVAEMFAAEKWQAFANIGLTRNTVAERISELAGDVDWQLMDKVMSFIAFLVAIDDSMDVTYAAQEAMFICSVGENLTVADGFFEMVQMTEPTTVVLMDTAGLPDHWVHEALA